MFAEQRTGFKPGGDMHEPSVEVRHLLFHAIHIPVSVSKKRPSYDFAGIFRFCISF